MKLSTQPYKGTRDFYPEDMRLRNWMFSKMRSVCESYGYEEYDAPVLEPIELFVSKTSEEIVNEQSYSFTDRGDRKVIMRPEMTPSISRMVAARRQELGYPLRLYNIANFFRYERPQKGRLREFWQLNADIFGVKGAEADVEVIKVADSIMRKLGARPEAYEIRINSKQLLRELLIRAGIQEKDLRFAIRTLDAIERKGAKQTFKKLVDQGADSTQLEELIFKLKNDKPSDYINQKGPSVRKLIDIFLMLEKNGIKATYSSTLARGFDYYTDIVFEIFDKNPDNNRSLFGGGRYDGLVSNFGVEPVPTVGFGMGDVTLANFLKSNNLIPELKPATDVAILSIGQVYQEVQTIADKLRKLGVNVSLDYEDKKIDKKIKSAAKRGEKYALFIGQDEISQDKFTLKDLESAEEIKDSIENIAKAVLTSKNRG